MSQYKRMTKAQLLEELELLRTRVSILESSAGREETNESPDRLIPLYGNPEATVPLGIKADEWLGREFNEIWPEVRELGQTETFLEVVRTGTRYSPRIAVGLVPVDGITEWVVGGITSNGALEFYVATTGGLWFLFEKAEKALGEESRRKVVGWVREVDPKACLESPPSQFAYPFADRGSRWQSACRLGLEHRMPPNVPNWGSVK